MKHIEEKIAALYAQFAEDNELSLVEAQQLLQGDDYRTWRMDLEQYVAEIKATGNTDLLRELNILAARSRITRLDKLRAETIVELGRLADATAKDFDTFLPTAYTDFYYRNLFEIGRQVGLQESVTQVDRQQIENVLRTPWSGKNYSERIWHNSKRLENTIQREIVAAVHRGTTIQDMSRVVRQRMNVGRYEATRLVRTELNYVENRAALDGIKDSGMKYYQFVAILDKRTSHQCREHDGKIYPVDEYSPGTNAPPLHPHCRSVIIGSIKGSVKRTGQRAARDEQNKYIRVPASMTYREWFDKYIVQTENLRRKVAADGHEIIDQPTYHKLTKKFVKNGGIIIRGKEAEHHLKQMGAYASYIPGMEVAFIRDDARVSDVIEEMYHAKQNRANMFGTLDEPLTLLKREIDAQKYLLKVQYKYKIPVEETITTKRNLAYYEDLLKRKSEGE